MLSIGLHHNISHAAYHGDPCDVPSLSSHLAGLMVSRSAVHGYHAHPRLGKGEGSKFTPATSKGAIVHGLVLGSAQDVVVIDAKDYRKKATQEARDKATEEGKIPMLSREYQPLREVASSIAGELAPNAGAGTEVTGVWEIGNGCLARCRMDFLDHRLDIIHDLKTCEDCVAASSGSAVIRYGMHIQAAAYLECMRTLYPEVEGRQKFIFHFRELVAPFVGIDAELDGQLLELGLRQWNRAKAMWIEGMTTGHWYGPTRIGSVKRIACPPWALIQDAEQQSEQIAGGSQDVSF